MLLEDTRDTTFLQARSVQEHVQFVIACTEQKHLGLARNLIQNCSVFLRDALT